MKILVISTPIFRLCPPQGTVGYAGLEVLAYQQAEGLAKLGHDVSIVAPDGSVCPGATVIPVGPERGIDEKRAYKKYWSTLPGFDAIVDNSWQKWSYMLKAEGRLKAPILGVLHAPVATMYQSLPPVENPCFVCISKDQADSFKGIFDREAEVAYNGVDPDHYQPLGIPRTNRFLFLARFSSVKSPDVAIQACKEAGVPLDLVGDTSITNEPALLEVCKKMADGKKIRFVGPAIRGETVFWYSQAHALIHAIRKFREPFGLAPVESMLCGSPVVSWDNGAMRETICPGVSGFIRNNYPGFVKSVQATANKNWDRSKIRDWARQFSIENMIRRYEELCKKAIENPW